MVIPSGLKLRHIEAFLAVADLGSVSAAGRRMHVSQPALSKTIAEAERLLGQALFDRSGRRMALTVAGRLFRRHAQAALQTLETGVRALEADAPGAVIPVGVLPTVAGGLFPNVAMAFADARPDAVISVTTGPHPFLLDRLRAGGIDLMVGRMPEPEEMSGLRFEFLYEDAIVLTARAGHPGLRLSAAEALATYPVILPTRSSIIRKIVDGFVAAQGLAPLTPALETVSLALARPMVTGSDRLWFISQGVVARELAAGTLAALDLGAGYMSGAVGITRRRDGALGRDAAFLVEMLRGGGETTTQERAPSNWA